MPQRTQVHQLNTVNLRSGQGFGQQKKYDEKYKGYTTELKRVSQCTAIQSDYTGQGPGAAPGGPLTAVALIPPGAGLLGHGEQRVRDVRQEAVQLRQRVRLLVHLIGPFLQTRPPNGSLEGGIKGGMFKGMETQEWMRD